VGRLVTGTLLCLILTFFSPSHSTCFTLFNPLHCSRGRRYSDWLRVGRPRGWKSSPGRCKIFLFSASSRLVLGPTQPPAQWVPGASSPEVKRPWCETEHSPPTSVEAKNTWIYTSTSICLHGAVLNQLSTGTILPRDRHIIFRSLLLSFDPKRI
jgi:hypothetical protein